MKEMPDLICSKAAVGRNYNSTRDKKCDTKELCRICVVDDSIEIVKQAAAEYDSGWIPVSEQLPEESLNSVIGWDAYRERICFVHFIRGRFILGDDTDSVNIIAWQPLPQPYHPKGERETC